MAAISVELTVDEALVLFDLLHRWEAQDHIGNDLQPGEQTALWGLSASLERELVEPFDPLFGDLVIAARARLVERGGA